MEAVDLSDKQGLREDSIEQIAVELDVGLKSCRTLLDDYREKLSAKSVGRGRRIHASLGLGGDPAGDYV